jgi:hypothetical protein
MITWKSVLNDYIRESNRTEVEHSLEGVGQERLVLRSETSARLMQTREFERQIIADVRKMKRKRYETGIESERVELEQLTFTYRRGEWVITKIEPLQTERGPIKTITIDQDYSKRSEPYINRAVLSNRAERSRSFHYNRQLAVNYANKWWDKANPNYEHMEVDCTNFVSQCLFAGGAPMNYTGRRESGWWYEGYKQGRERWSFSWAVANSLQTYLQNNRIGIYAETVDSAPKLELGDIISYDWDGDSRYQHSTIVTGFDLFGEPLVNAHTNDSRNRYWDYRDSHAWTERTRYTFLHILDRL